FFTLGSEDVFLDCGAYNGDTVKRFLEAVHHHFRAIHAFEIAPGNYTALLDAVSALPEAERSKIRCHNAGVWDDDKGFAYGKEERGTGESFSILKTEHQAQAQTMRLDTLAEAEGFTGQTLIKMDIEGAELRALKGAEKFLRRCKPKLAVCVYHRLEDFWAIPMYVKSVRPDYRFGVKHHQKGTIGGTVLYAW
uniref:FkbM family methyltransferase n=1 Tax=uncultured Mailhella sp. TaxID=1981031 RepID=UPI0026382118